MASSARSLFWCELIISVRNPLTCRGPIYVCDSQPGGSTVIPFVDAMLSEADTIKVKDKMGN